MTSKSHNRLLAEMLKSVTTHAQRETTITDSYRELIEQSTDEGVKYLGRLIVGDEELHHHVTTEMANRIVSWDKRVDIAPHTPALSPRVDLALLEATRHLIALERQDAKGLRRLKRELKDTSPTSLLPLIVNLMLHDSAKHIEILQFIHDYGA